MIICTARHDATKFDWGSKNPSEEASTLCGNRKLWSQIYDDACDVGFVLVNPKTGTEAVFHLAKELMHGEEVGGWEFKPIPETLRKCPKLNGVVLTVFND